MSQTRTEMSIGEVLKALREEFTDVSISKIRFLETEGLIDPERTPSGYRKFYPDDVARLRYILRLQRDQFMPLKVIRKRLENFDPAQEAASGSPNGSVAETPAAQPPTARPGHEEEALLEGGLTLTWDDFLSATALSPEEVGELEEFGLIQSRLLNSGEVFYNEDDLQVAKIARDFGKYGIQPRHLKMYKNFADKEAGLFEQVLVPLSKRSGGEARRGRTQSLADLAKLSRRLRQTLLRASLRRLLNSN